MRKRLLVVDSCYEKASLSSYEFVRPIELIFERSGCSFESMHFLDVTDEILWNFEKVVLCGTALKDNGYQRSLESFSWIKRCKKPILGICAGMQVIGAVFGGLIVPFHHIGQKKMDIIKDSSLLGEPRTIEGYHLHNYAVTLPDEFLLLAGSPRRAEAFQHSLLPIYGVIFHPEVRNRWILEKFIDL